MMFKLQDRIIWYGKTGIIVKLPVIYKRSGQKSKFIGVQFDEKFSRGHNCNEHGKDGYCYYPLTEEVKKIDISQYENLKLKGVI